MTQTTAASRQRGAASEPSQFNIDRTLSGSVDDHLQQPADQHLCSLNDRRIGNADDRT